MRALFFLFLASAFAAEAGVPSDGKVQVIPADDGWRFTLAVPGWMPGITGDVGIGSEVGGIDVGFFDTILPRVDMIWATRAEASKGRFGILGELIYLNMSDGVGTEGLVKKVDVRIDEYLGDLAARWRIIEGPRGYLDLLVGVRYTNLYQAVGLQGNEEQIEEAASGFVDEIGERLRDSVEQRLGEGQFRNALVEAIDRRITSRLTRVTGAESSERTLPVAPVAVNVPLRVSRALNRLVQSEKGQLLAATVETARAAAAAEIAAARATIVADRNALRARAAALRARVDQRIATAKSNLQKKIERELESSLNQQVSRGDDWWDPYLGLRARYNLSEKFYVTARGDIGGFGIGSDLMWQAEGAVGVQLSPAMFAELGYRALSFDYRKDGLVFDTITHGAQLTVGLQF